MKLYIDGPLFNPGERVFVDELADRLEAVGHECFVPHRQEFAPMDSATVFAVDSAGVHGAEAMVAWLDGPMVDDGTACEIGIFSELVRTDPTRYRGIVGLSMDWRVWRQRDAGGADGALNYFVAGAIERAGRIVWSIDDVVEVLTGWASGGAQS